MRRSLVLTSHAVAIANHAAAHRASPTLTEAILWQVLSGSKLGVGFRRQVPIGRYIADFVAPSRKLVVEVDGGYHALPAQVRADARRDRYLAKLGYRVVRLPAAMVQHQLAEAVALVVAALER
jgi:very-short-patch-repair endonuclease